MQFALQVAQAKDFTASLCLHDIARLRRVGR
jgi:hypothetical protein